MHGDPHALKAFPSAINQAQLSKWWFHCWTNHQNIQVEGDLAIVKFSLMSKTKYK